MDKMIVAKTILSQLGGNKFIVMTGAKNFIGGDNSLTFKFMGGGYCKIVLNSLDLYDIEFYKIRKTDKIVQKKYDGIYCDQLQDIFSKATGLATHL